MFPACFVQISPRALDGSFVSPRAAPLPGHRPSAEGSLVAVLSRSAVAAEFAYRARVAIYLSCEASHNFNYQHKSSGPDLLPIDLSN